MTNEEAISYIRDILAENNSIKPSMVVFELEKEALYMAIKALEQESTTKDDLEIDTISRADALRVAENEYLRGWHNALCKALSEKYSIHCEGNFSVIQEETIVGLGLSMNCALGKDAESYMSTMPSVQPTRPRGKWTETSLTQVSGGDFNRGFKCSCCDYVTVVDDFNYCPNCGAKMEEEEE